MPELPEVETVVRSLSPVIMGRTINEVILKRRDLRFSFPQRFRQVLANTKIINISRRAKYILIHLGNEKIWITHLGMTGMLSVRDKSDPLQKHDHVVVDVGTNIALIYNDPRRFGYMDVCDVALLHTHKFFKNLGSEPFDKGFDGAYLKAQLQAKTTPIKVAIMNQNLVVGVGNIYASEALHDAKIDPRRAANSLSLADCKTLVRSIQKTLTRAIEAGGSSIQHFENPMGDSGYFQYEFKVYEQAGMPCACKSKKGIIEKISQQGRSTYFCASCQK